MRSYGTARCATTSVLRNRHSAPRQGLKFERPLLRNDIFSIAQIHPPHASLSWAALRADDSPFCDYTVVCRCSGCTRPLAAVPTYLATSSCISHNCIRRGTPYLPPRKVAPPNSAKSDGAKLDGPKLEAPKPTQAPPPPDSLPMKIFFSATALALAASTSITE
jgi:hypothetical protein